MMISVTSDARRPRPRAARTASKLSVTWFGAIALAALPSLSQADEQVAAFYKDKTFRLQVGAEPGSSFDLSARLLGRHIGKHIPGTPNVIVQNVAGAGSFTLTNQLYNVAPRDGTVIGAIINGVPTGPLLRPKNVQFDVTRLNWIGNINKESHVLIAWHAAAVKTLDELASKPLIVGATTIGTANVDYPLLLNDVLGFRFKIVAGYSSSSTLSLAMERGEVEGNAGTLWTTVKMNSQDQLASGKIKVIGQYSFEPRADLPGVPMILDLATNDADRQALTLAFIRQEFGRSFIAPPGIPDDRVEALRRAFDATMKDPAFLAEAEQARLEVEPTTGEALTRLVGKIVATPPDVVKRVRDVFEKGNLRN
jgi:tripartite-type tricarboxylate transporter receptor subunit TctC